MKTKRLLEKLAHFLGSEQSTQLDELESIKKVLKKLKKKERELREALDDCPDGEEKGSIDAKLEVIYAQRGKGLARMRELRELRRAEKE